MNSLDKVFIILESVIGRQGAGASFTDVQSDTGLPRATVHRVLKNLAQLSYLTYDPELRRYRGSLKVAGLGAEVMANFNLRDHVHPFLLRMNRESEFASNAGIKDGLQGVYIDKVATKDLGIKLIGEVGKRFMLHCTGMGKVLLAHGEAEEVDRVLKGPLTSFTKNTIIDPDRLLRELAQIRSQGFALDREEVTRGIMCLAAPVRGAGERVVCSLSVAFPAYVASEKGLEPIVELVKRYAAECSEASI